MQQVFSPLGPGQIVASETVRGRTSHKVAGQGFEQWFDEAKLGFAPVDHENSVALPYDPSPQYGVGPLSESTIQPIHEIDPDDRLHPADSLSFDSVGESEAGRQPGPNPDLFAKSSAIGDPVPHQTGPMGLDHNAPELREYAHPDFQDQHDDYHPSDAYALENRGPEDIYSPAAQQQAPARHLYDPEIDGYFDPAKHVSYRQADVLEGPAVHSPEFIVNDTDDEYLQDVDVEKDERQTTGPEDIVHFSSRHEAIIPLLVGEGLAEAAGAGAGAEGAGAGGIGALTRGLGPGAIDEGKKIVDSDHPLPLPDLGYGWGDMKGKMGGIGIVLDRAKSLGQHPIDAEGGYPVQDAHEWAHQNPEPPPDHEEWGWQRGPRPAGLDERYAEIITTADYHNSPVAQFQHDPAAFIARVGHVMDEGLNPRMAAYMDLVEADVSIREAAWKDVRAKATRLRREGRVHVKDIGPDRIYASVEGDHGTYDVMIKKGGSFGGFGGGHAVSNWHCSCEWGKWAFKRQLTFVGRLCSHGYASYQEMQSNHTKGQPRMQRQERPRTRRASDETTQDWKVKDTGGAKSALEDIRDWAEEPHSTWDGHQQEHVDDVRDAVETAREYGVDADALVASLRPLKMAAPGDPVLPYSPSSGGTPSGDAGLSSVMNPGGMIGQAPAAAAPSGGTGAAPFSAGNPQTAVSPQMPGGAAGAAPSANDASATGLGFGAPAGGFGVGNSTTPSVNPATATQGVGQPTTSTGPNTNAAGGSSFYQDAYGADGAKGGGGGGSNPNGNDHGIQGPGIAGNPGGPSESGSYTVKPGDTLSDIAQSHGMGNDYQDLAKSNNISNPDLIHPGDSINFGDSGGGSKTQGPGLGNNGPADTSAVTGTGGGSSGSSGTGDALGNAGAETSAVTAPSANASSGTPSGASSSGLDTGSSSDVASAGTGAGSGSVDDSTGKTSGRRLAAPDIAPVGLDSPENTNPALNNPVAPSAKPAAPSTGGGAGSGAAWANANGLTRDNSGGGGGLVAPKQQAPKDPGTDAGDPINKPTDTGAGAVSGGGGTSAPAGGMGGLGDMGGMMSTIGDIAGPVSSGIGQVTDALGGASGIASGIGNAVSGIGSALSGILGNRQISAQDRQDYLDWHMAAYPDAYPDHAPFAGSGPRPPLQFTDSKSNVKEHYSDDREDVTDLPSGDLHKFTEEARENALKESRVPAGGGIRRAGHGPTRPSVVPEVVRERKPRSAATQVEAAVPDYLDFDPYAEKTAADFLDAAPGEDIVAAFQRSAGAQAVMSSAPSGGSQYDDFSSSPAFAKAMQRTAGRNYSLAEQAALVREGDKGGAGNLDSLDLAGTHYEAMNSVGLF
jgi:LysM repeat protein